MDVTLVELSEENREAALALRVSHEQERFVGGSVADALAEATGYSHAKPWYRLALAGDVAVGFVMISWNVEPQPPEIIGPWFLWKLLIDQRYQGQGHGAGIVRQVADLVRAQGAAELLTSLVPGAGGPGGFYERLGFVPTGEFDINGEAILRLALT